MVRSGRGTDSLARTPAEWTDVHVGCCVVSGVRPTPHLTVRPFAGHIKNFALALHWLGTDQTASRVTLSWLLVPHAGRTNPARPRELLFEKPATKDSGGKGRADVWRRGRFAWEYKSKGSDLVVAFDQLRRYALALDNPPLLVVSDMERFSIHTNWAGTESEMHEFTLDDLARPSAQNLLKWVMLDSEQLRPGTSRQALTEEAAASFAKLAQSLRARGAAAGERPPGGPAREVRHHLSGGQQLRVRRGRPPDAGHAPGIRQDLAAVRGHRVAGGVGAAAQAGSQEGEAVEGWMAKP